MPTKRKFNHIGDVIYWLRIIYETKTKDLAAKVQISANYISDIESGRKKPSLELIEMFASAFNIPASKLIEYYSYVLWKKCCIN